MYMPSKRSRDNSLEVRLCCVTSLDNEPSRGDGLTCFMRGDDNDDLVPGCSGLGIAGEYMYRMRHGQFFTFLHFVN